MDEKTMNLVAGAQAGDAVMREALFERYLPRVRRMVAARLGVKLASLSASGEDAVQAVLVRALTGLDRFEMRSCGAFAAWMQQIVLNVIRSQYRDAHGERHRVLWQRYGDLDLNESIFHGDGPTPSMVALQNESNERIESAMLELPAIRRDALSMRAFGDLSYAEIAQQLGHSEASCRKLVQRAKEELQARLAQRP
jgi:RNA polymerase sigma-70 factor (ECF subfamily)